MMITTGRLSFDSGYTTKVSTDRPSCFTVTHSLCRGDFASVAFAQSCAETVCAIPRIIKTNRIRFICPPNLMRRVALEPGALPQGGIIYAVAPLLQCLPTGKRTK